MLAPDRGHEPTTETLQLEDPVDGDRRAEDRSEIEEEALTNAISDVRSA